MFSAEAECHERYLFPCGFGQGQGTTAWVVVEVGSSAIVSGGMERGSRWEVMNRWWL